MASITNHSTQLKLSWAMIVRDAEKTLETCLESIVPYIDQLIIVLAGKSRDKTAEIARRYTSEVYEFKWIDDFAAARNFAFSKATGEWIGWCDADDVVVGGENIRQLIADAEAKGIGCMHWKYEYRHDERGAVTVVHYRERLLRLDLDWSWRGRVHEYCNAAREHLVGTADDVVIKHTTDKANTERNLRLLQLMEKEITEDDPEYPRLMGCFQDIYQSQGQWVKSVEYGERFFEAVGVPGVKWTAATELARSYQGLRDWPQSIHWAHVATSIHPEFSLPYLLLAHAAWFGYQESEKALLYLRDAEDRLPAPLGVFRQPQDYTLRRWDIEHRCYADQSRWQEALDACVKGLKEIGGIESEDYRNPTRTGTSWHCFAWYYMERVNCEKSVAGVAALVDHLARRGDLLRARRLMENDLPVSIREDERMLRLHSRLRELTAHVTEGDAKYQEFYDTMHSESDALNAKMMNGIDIDAYRLDPLIERLKKRGAKRILDVGCGAGEPSIYLAKHGFSVVGLDINAKEITEARRRAKRATKRNGLRPWQLEFRAGTLETLGPENLGKFDAIVMMELIEHLPPEKLPFYLGACEDFLDEGGAVYITTPGMAVGDIPGIWGNFPRDHVVEFSRQDLERMLVQPTKRQRLPISLHKLYDPTVGILGFASWFLEYEVYPETPAWENWQKPIVIYAGQGLEQWTPETPDTVGLGGSETWAAKVARELRAKGHPVIVYGAVDGVWDGVIYRQAFRFDPKAPFAGEKAWLCVVSRRLDMLDERPNAEHVLFVAHDVDYGEALTAERLTNIDAYCVLSEWQRQHTEGIYREEAFSGDLRNKLRIIQNGIELEFFEGEAPERVKHSFLWASSPDRGLDKLLAWWLAIREMWPDATLKVAYGWENIDALSSNRPWLQPYKARLMQALRQDGVTWLGRMGQRELAQEWRKTQFWLYPSSLPDELGGGVWRETFCITALEAAAGGCRGIIPNAGALEERPGWHEDGEVLTWEAAKHALLICDAAETPAFDANQWSWTRAAESLLACVKEAVYV